MNSINPMSGDFRTGRTSIGRAIGRDVPPMGETGQFFGFSYRELLALVNSFAYLDEAARERLRKNGIAAFVQRIVSTG